MARRKFASCPLLDELISKAVSLFPAGVEELVTKKDSFVGRVNLNYRGFGFVTTEADESFYISSELVRPLLTGDEINFVPAPPNPESDGREIKAVVSVRRASFLLLGEAQLEADDSWCLRSDEPCFTRVMLTAEDVAQHGVKVGDVIAVRIEAYEGQPLSRPLQVAIALVLGDRNRPGFAQEYALVKHGFHETFPETVLAGADKGWEDVAGKPRDLTAIPFVTIDGESTRDFDDAIYAEANATGWLVRVAVSDVSWYVRPGTALDSWAAERCTSVYLPGKTVPMLPEVLSTGRCSLTPGEDRRVVVMTCQLGLTGEVSDIQFERAIIRSAARLTYAETASFMESRGARFSGEVELSLAALESVYQLLAEQRNLAGKLEFDEPEPRLESTPDGKLNIVWESRTDAHKLVEELMLLANRVAAERLLARYGAAVLRHQPAPADADWHELRTWALLRDFALPEAPSMRALADFAASPSDADGVAAVSHRIRACMQPAKYVMQDDTVDGGHFSLGFDWYTHFTSPIRRYADLLVHRLLLAPEGTSLAGVAGEELARLVAHCSERSQAARLAERGVWDGFKLQTFTAEVSQSTLLRARVVRVTGRGLRVVIQGWQCGAWLPAGSLRANGFKFENDVWVGPVRPGQLSEAHEGCMLIVRWKRVVRDRPAYPELNVELAAN